MKIKLSFVGYLKLGDLKSGDVIDVDDGITVAQLLTGYGMRREHQRFVCPIVNGEERRLPYVLQEGDELTLYLPVGGG